MRVKREAKIYIRRLPSGNVSFRVDLGKNDHGKRVTKDFENEIEARKFKAKADEQLHKRNLGALQDLVDSQRYEILAALELLKPYPTVTLREAIEFYIKYANPPKGTISVKEAVEKFVASRRKLKRTERYIHSALQSYFNSFCERYGDKMANEITETELEKFIFVNGRSSSTILGYIRNLNALFSYLVNRGHCTWNPLTKIERPTKKETTVEILSDSDTSAILQYALDHDRKPECACATLVFLCGVRVEEVEKMEWRLIDLEARLVYVTAKIAKNGKRRVNSIPENALEWLRLCAADGRVAPPNYKNRMRAIRRGAKVAYIQNAMRHSFASYHIAMHENAHSTAMLLGHPNANLLYNTYRHVTTKTEAERYWAILPKSVVEDRAAKQAEAEKEADDSERELAEAASNCGKAIRQDGEWIPVQERPREHEMQK